MQNTHDDCSRSASFCVHSMVIPLKINHTYYYIFANYSLSFIFLYQNIHVQNARNQLFWELAPSLQIPDQVCSMEIFCSLFGLIYIYSHFVEQLSWLGYLAIHPHHRSNRLPG
ncbi:hypothetical protein O6H91_14G078900 [Diphasiastrum complanatum]|uniref:Uncharacterized protein n=1 Tax=Diphasiastrum complanatum TaxID=34168 RepID=A0ACC2BRB2_DIPCM|nr:hypothetical protein O6H91_14G078900 [Diphasiastrum complanatum]